MDSILNAQCCESPKSLTGYNNPGPLDRLKQQSKELGERKAKVDAAITALETNPEVSKLLTLVHQGLAA